MATSRTLAALATAGALGLAGCGGGDDGPSREEYAQRIDEICSDLENQLERVQQTDADSPEEASQQLEDMQRRVERGIDRLADEARPSGDAGDTAERYVDALRSEWEEQAQPALKDLQEALRDRDEVQARSAAERLQSIEDTESDRLAEELGADECAED